MLFQLVLQFHVSTCKLQVHLNPKIRKNQKEILTKKTQLFQQTLRTVWSEMYELKTATLFSAIYSPS